MGPWANPPLHKFSYNGCLCLEVLQRILSLYFEDDADLYYYGYDKDYYSLPFTFPFLGRDIVQINVNSNGLVELLEEGESEVGFYGPNSHYWEEYEDAIFVASDDLETGIVVEGNSQQVDIYWYGSTYSDYASYTFVDSGLTMKLTLFPNGGIKWKFFDMDYSGYDEELYSGLASIDAVVELEVPGGSLGFQGTQVYTAFRYNGAPTAVDDAAATAEDNPVIIDVLANDTEAEGDALSVVNVTQGTYGAVVDNGDGTVTYTPVAEYSGADNFTYTVSDGISGTDTATVSLTVTSVNDAPTIAAIADPAAIDEDAGQQSVDLAGIGTGAANETQPLTVTATSSNTGLIPHPAVTYTPSQATGSLSYTPVPDSNGTVIITVKVKDDGGTANGGVDSVQTTFTVTVNAVNDAPVALADAVTTPEDTAATVLVLANDSDVDGDILTIASVTQGNHGVVAIDEGDTTLTYTPNPNFWGVDSLTYTVSDGKSGLDTATVLVTLTSVNDAPTVAAISDPAAIDEDAGQQSVDLTGIGTGAANESQALTIMATSDNPGLIPDSAVTYTSPAATGTLTYTPVADAYGTATITVTVKDDGGTANGGVDSVLTTFTVMVNAVNDAPTVTAISNPAAIDEDAGEQVINLSGIGTGAANEGQALTITATSDNPGLIPDPVLIYTSPQATGSLSYTTVPDSHGTAIITVKVKDDGGTANGGVDSVQTTFTITVNAVNDAPIIAAISDPAAIDVDAGQQSVNLTGIGTGAANETQTLTVTATSSNTGLIPDPAVTYSSPAATGTLTYTPVADVYGTATITVMVKDDGGTANGGVDSVETSFTVTVNLINDPPTIAAISDPAAIDEDAAEQVINLSGISTGAANETQTLTLTAISSNTDLIPDPTVTYTSPQSTGSLAYTPEKNAYGTATITVRVEDDGGTANGGVDSVQTTFTITVNPVNDAPVALADTVTTPEDTSATVLVLANDSDMDGDTLTIASVTQGNHGVVAIDEGDTTLTYTPNANFWGVDSLTYTVSDGKSGLDTATVLITLTSVNDPPAAFALVSPGHDSTLVISNANLGDTLTFAWEAAVDVDGDTVRYGAELTDGLGALLTFGDTTATEVRLPYAAVAAIMEGLGQLTITGTWDIFAADGEDITWASNGPFTFTVDATTLDVLRQALLPQAYALHQNYPNPFNPSTTLRFDLPQAAEVYLVVYDLLGREVVRLLDSRWEPGYHQVVWNGRDRYGRNVPSGIYIARLFIPLTAGVAPEYSKSIKMLLLK